MVSTAGTGFKPWLIGIGLSAGVYILVFVINSVWLNDSGLLALGLMAVAPLAVGLLSRSWWEVLSPAAAYLLLVLGFIAMVTLGFVYPGDLNARELFFRLLVEAWPVWPVIAAAFAAVALQKKLELIRDGEPPYDIYVRWKPLHQQPIGWDPDLNDGVRLNIRPFVEAGVLRSRVNVNWKKDRGLNPDGSERINDRHYTIAEKRAARGAAKA